MRSQPREFLVGLLLLALASTAALAEDSAVGVRLERADAPSRPATAHQRTLVDGPLHAIAGTTTADDPLDAYCVNIPSLENFMAAPDPKAGLAPVTLALRSPAGRLILTSQGPSPERQPLIGAAAGTRGAETAATAPERQHEYTLVVSGTAGAASAASPYAIDLAGAEGCAGANHVRRAVAIADFNGDSLGDAAFTNISAAYTCLGDGTGAFDCSAIVGISCGTGIAPGFLDGDEHLDLAFSQDCFNGGEACLGDGLGGFTCSPFAEVSPNITTGIAMADLNNDGPLDVIISARDGDSLICFGDGAGDFPDCRPINNHRYRALGVAIGVLAPASVGHDDFESGDLRAWATSVPDS